ncbi:MAG: hypothetical protein ABR526_12775 [Chthoniobacterales bacterium]
MKTLRLFLIAAVTTLSVNFSRATTVIPPSFTELVNEAELIFQGTCTDSKSEWIGEGAQRHIITNVTFKVEDALKGSPGASYTIQMLGGTVDGTTMEVSDSPKFKPGDRDILFVQHNGEQFIPLVGIMHGRYRIEKDQTTGAEKLMTNGGRALGDVKNVGQDEHAAANGNEKAMAPAEFKAAIRAKLAGRNEP